MHDPYTAGDLKMMKIDLNLLKKGTEITTQLLESFAKKDTDHLFGKFIGDLSAHHRKEVIMLEEQIERIEDMMRQIGTSQHPAQNSTTP